LKPFFQTEIAMRHSIIQTYSPEGFSAAAAAQTQREAGEMAVAASSPRTSEDDRDRAADQHGYDDGLVHSHGWAMSTDR
jgi:hypothetical protein